VHDIAIVEVSEQRAEQVRKELKKIQGALKANTWVLADLLEEAVANNYPELWGFSSFKDWLEDSELDVKERQAYHLIRINSVAKELKISRDKLNQVKISKLKAIFALDPETQSDKIKDLVKRAVNMSLEDIDKETRKLRGLEGDKGTWRNFYFEEEDMAETVDSALETVRVEAGQEMSDAAALELMAADRISAAKKIEEQEEKEALES
jgi:hypothetical protein